MRKIQIPLFDCLLEENIDVICIPTNSHYTIRGSAILEEDPGKTCVERFPDTGKRLGKMLKSFGRNIPFVIGATDDDGNSLEPTRELIRAKQFKCLIMSLPTINHVANGPNLELIKQSATLIKDYAEQFHLKNIVIPILGKPLPWDIVNLELSKILDDRFIITEG